MDLQDFSNLSNALNIRFSRTLLRSLTGTINKWQLYFNSLSNKINLIYLFITLAQKEETKTQ